MKTPSFSVLLLATLLVLGSAPAVFAQVKEGHEAEDAGKGVKAETLLAKFPPGSSHEAAFVPMRDGVKLATDVFIPPGKGSWPVVFSRGFYGRLNSGWDAKTARDGTVVYVTQDARGVYDSDGKGTINVATPDTEINDSSDTLDWIAAQSWCNGKIGMTGASGNGVGPFAGFISKNPHLLIAQAGSSAPWHCYYFGFHNGVRRNLYTWFTHAGVKVPEWPKPTIFTYDAAHWKTEIAAAGKNSASLILTSGWYDISPEATLDIFSACASTCKIFATVKPGGHGGTYCPFTWPNKPNPKAPTFIPTLPDILTGKGKLPEKSQLAYFLMGNFRDPASPGNYYKVTDAWPVPNTPTSFYLHADGGLSTAKPTGANAALSYAYDPKDPAPSPGIKANADSGPHDQRPLKDRKDILRFVGVPLEVPLEITGRLLADLYFSTDVTDTEFVVKFIDIQPDGYEMLIRESAAMGRNAEEFAGKPAALEKGKVYRLKIDMRNTAIVLDKGHRLGVLVSSASKPEYEVHPNTFAPAMSYDKSPVAHQVLHLSAQTPSCIVLPVITAGTAASGTP